MKSEDKAAVVELLEQDKPGLAIRECIARGITPKEFRKILREGSTRIVTSTQVIRKCYGTTICVRNLPQRG